MFIAFYSYIWVYNIPNICVFSGGWGLPSGYVKIAIEHGHRNSGFSH